MGVAGVLHQPEAAPAAEVDDRRHVAGVAVDVDDDDRPGPGVMAASIAAGSMLPVSGSQSTSTGTALTTNSGMTVERNVNVGAITSSPASSPRPKKAECRAAVPELQANVNGTPM